jgi:hypothetical protein
MTSNLTGIADGVHVAEASQRFLGLEIGARMTVLELDGGLLLHSPIATDAVSLSDLGTPRWVLAPNLFHHLYVGPWVDQGLEAWAAPGLEAKRSDLTFKGTLARAEHPFGDDIELFSLTCFSMTNEVVVLHRPSATLVVADLVFNLPPTAPWATRAGMRAILGYPGCRSTLLERLAMKRDRARREVGELLELPFDRLVMAHGDVVEEGGPDALHEAFRWLFRQSV